MSDSLPPDPAPVSPPPPTEPPWIKPFMAIGSLALFAGMTGVSVVIRNDSAVLMLVGAAISMATSAFNYYIGSSSGSARKTELAATPSAK